MATEVLDKPTTDLIKIEEVAATLSTAGAVLTKNENLLNTAKNAGQTLLDTIEGQGMSDELDAAVNTWQVKAKDALSIMNKRRAPITQMITLITKTFTGLEGEIDPAKPLSVYSKLQAYRNSYAKQKADAQKVKEAEILKQQNIDKEKISLKAEVTKQIREAYQKKVLEFKTFYTNKLNSATLENFEKVSNSVSNVVKEYKYEDFYKLPVNVSAVYVEKAELAEIVMDCRVALYDELSANFRENMEDQQRILVDLLPSKKAELEKIAQASGEEKDVLVDQAKQRQVEDAQKLQEQAIQAIAQDNQNIELTKQIETSNTLFDSAAQLAEVQGPAGQVRQGYKISVTSAAGWGAIFLFWFEKEGQKMKPEDMGKKSLDQMKSFCEKYAHKNNEKIAHSTIVYQEDFKAIATKQ